MIRFPAFSRLLLWQLIAGTGLAAAHADQSEFSGKTMGPIDYRVVVVDEVEDAKRIEQGIAERLDTVNRLMSTWIDDSDVSRINRATADEWTEVDPLTLQVIQKSVQLSELTDGAFDVTVGPAVKLWNFGAGSSKPRIPDPAEIEAVQEVVGYESIAIREQPPAVKKSDDLTQIDLSAIAKGFAVDQVAEFLQSLGIENFMVEVGGEVVCFGQSKSGPWRIGIEKPVVAIRSVDSVVVLEAAAMATSGDYRNFYEIDGQRYSHTIDPRTCRPVTNRLASCSVIAGDCLTADAIATAVMVLGSEQGLKLCRQNQWQLATMTRVASDPDKLVSNATELFPFAEQIPDQEELTSSIWPAFIGAMVIFLLAVAGMAIGAVFNNRPITGSCGGIAASQNEDGSSSCTMCQKPVTDCPERETAET